MIHRHLELVSFTNKNYFTSKQKLKILLTINEVTLTLDAKNIP